MKMQYTTNNMLQPGLSVDSIEDSLLIIQGVPQEGMVKFYMHYKGYLYWLRTKLSDPCGIRFMLSGYGNDVAGLQLILMRDHAGKLEELCQAFAREKDRIDAVSEGGRV